jgi:IPT/TIG domain
MSSLVYGVIKGKRVAAPAKQSRTTASPGIGTYVDTIAALVPAEALAIYAGVVIPYATHTSSLNGKKVTVISNPGLLGWSCAGLLALSSLLYLVGRKNPKLDWGILSVFIPPAAFAAWMLVQNPSVWDIWWPGSSIGERAVITVFAAVLLGILANTLSVWADAQPGVLAVTHVSPNKGPVAGSTKVTVTGSGFTTPKAVNFGQEPARDLKFIDDTKLTVTSPQAAAGTVDVTVTTSAGQTSPTSAADSFTYNGHPTKPTITDVNPNSGPVAGGTNVTVTGTGFTGATGVNFGPTAAPNPDVVSDTQLTVASPPAASPGPVDVTVTTPAGTSPTSPADHFTYEPVPAAPTVTGINPDRGAVAGGTNVTVTGTGFTGATGVNFGPTAAQNPDVVSDTQLTVVSPQATGPAGPVDVTVATPGGISATSPSDQFIYELLP